MNWSPHNLNSEVVYHGRGERSDYQGIPAAYYSFPFKRDICRQYQEQLNEQSQRDEQRKKDQECIDEFISKCEMKKAETNGEKSLKIFEAKQEFLKIISLKKSLENELMTLDINDENFDSKWVNIEHDMNLISDKLNLLVSNVEPLKKCLAKRMKKRIAIKKKRGEWSKAKAAMKKQIEEKNAVIDKLLMEKKHEVEDAKREAALKRQADSVLHEVRRKKHEGSKMLSMLSALAKLRDLRIKEEEKNGGYSSKQLTEVFNEVINRFKLLWEKQIEVYKLEEKGLKMMLEENTLPHSNESELEMNLLQWEKALFGEITISENERMLTKADRDLETFLQVRRDWDQYLALEPTAVSSSIPLGWVLPPESANEDWKEFLVKKKGKSAANQTNHGKETSD